MNILYFRDIFTSQLDASETRRAISDGGFVLLVVDGITRVSGVQDCMAGELCVGLVWIIGELLDFGPLDFLSGDQPIVLPIRDSEWSISQL